MMTSDTMRLLIQSPELLTRIALPEFIAMTAREVKDIPEPRLLVSELGPFGVPLAIVFPTDDYLELRSSYCRIIKAAEEIGASFKV